MLSPEDIIEKLTIELQKLPSVVAFTLIGSRARDSVYSATKDSDLEAYVVAKDGDVVDVEEKLTNILNKFGEILFSFKHDIGFMAIYDNLFRVEIPVVKETEMKSLFNRPKAQTVKVLIDKTNGVLEKTLDARPDTIEFPKIFDDKVTNFWNWQIIGAQYFKKGEIYNTRAILNIHASTLIKLFELLNDREILLLESNKRVEQFLTLEQLKLLGEITPAYEKSAIEISLRRAMEIFPPVFMEIKEKYGYDYAQSLEEKVKPRVLNLLKQ